MSDAAGRITRGWALAILAVLLFAVPAAAGIIIQNFMRADIEVSEPCFSKIGGTDTQVGGSFLTFDDTTTVKDAANGVDLLQETTTVRAFAGDRLIYGNAVVFGNECGNTVTVTLVSGDDPAGGAAIESPTTFTDSINVRFYLADAAGAPVVGLTGTWTEALRVIDGAATTGSPVAIATGSSATMAIVVDADAGAAGGTTGTLRWVAQADHG